jgi:protein-tyrosine-phosphatase
MATHPTLPFVPKNIVTPTTTPVPKPFIPPIPHGLFLSKQDLSDSLAAQTTRIVDLITTIHTTHLQQLTQLQLDHRQQITSLIDLHSKELQAMRDLIDTMRLQYDQNTRTLIDNMNTIVTTYQHNNNRLDDNIRTLVDITTRKPNDDVIVHRIDNFNAALETQIGTIGTDIVTAVRGPFGGQGVINVLGTKEITNEHASAMTVKELTYLINKVSSMQNVYSKRQIDKPTETRRQTIEAMGRNIIIMKEVRDRKKRHEGGIIPM